MATASTTSTLTRNQEKTQESEPTLKLSLKKEKVSRKIKWTEDTIDNEGLGKKKSKCCCQFTKPRQDLDESSSEEEEGCETCPGH